MSTAVDAVVRAWLVVAAWLGLSRATRVHRLARIRRPMQFVRAAIVPAGRLVALAIAFLPRTHRREAAITFLASKALVGFGDEVPAAVAYLTGESHCLPRAPRARSTRPVHLLDALLAARLPLLRAALKMLPGDAGRRCCASIERIGETLLQARADRRCGGDPSRPDAFRSAAKQGPESRCGEGPPCGDPVYGEAVFVAARLAVPSVRPPVFACNAAGRALQLAGEIGDAETAAARDRLIYQALQELPTVPRLLRWLPAFVEPGTRAAAALLAVAMYRFYLQAIGAPVPRSLRRPLGAALAAARSRDAYLDTVDAIEDGLVDARDALAGRLDDLHARPRPVEPSTVRADAIDADALSAAHLATSAASEYRPGYGQPTG